MKLWKCTFVQSTIDYLGHTISLLGVVVDSSKVQCIHDWPTPPTLKGLHGFLGLASYYQKFFQHFDTIARPLTDLLKKDSFHYSVAADEAFIALKTTLTLTPVLALPNFAKSFTVECDASNGRLGAVLSQDLHLIAYLSKSLSPNHQLLPPYDREMMAILFAVKKWRPYLIGWPFKIITDHQTLKYLLEQRITTSAQ